MFKIAVGIRCNSNLSCSTSPRPLEQPNLTELVVRRLSSDAGDAAQWRCGAEQAPSAWLPLA